MRQIKFRGRHIKNADYRSRVAPGEMVYGGYAVLSGAPHILFDGVAWQVESDSVQQLIGYDMHGKEVYEGDVISGQRRASFEDFSAINSGRAVLLEE